MSFGDKIRQYRNENHLEQKELAQILSVSKQTISAYEMRGNCPTYKDFIKICNTLRKDAHYFMQEELLYIENSLSDAEQKILSSYHDLSNSDRRVVDFVLGLNSDKTISENNTTPQIIYRLPIYRQDVAAGSGQFGIEQIPNYEDFQLDDIPNNISYGVRIKGDSMKTDDENNIPDKSIVLISTNFDQHELEKEAVVANLNSVLVCKEYNIAEGKHIWLKSRNRKRAAEDKYICDADGVKILGKVVKVII